MKALGDYVSWNKRQNIYIIYKQKQLFYCWDVVFQWKVAGGQTPEKKGLSVSVCWVSPLYSFPINITKI